VLALKAVIDYYENNDEDSRLSSNKARKIEFIISTKILDEYIQPADKILDAASGTGIYSLHYAESGHEVLAADITPKHIETLNMKIKSSTKKLNIETKVNNAIDLSPFDSESFDTVLCMGPLYHLIEKSDREKCISECIRVLKKGGVLAIAYINKYYIIPHLLTGRNKLLTSSLVSKVIDEGVIKDGEEDCFWTDAFFTSPIEIEEFLSQFNIDIIDHAAVDGLSPYLRGSIDAMSDEEYEIWVNYQLKTCREKTILGISNHGLVICKKK
jgi:2-polyprenyl-3-methyl-5-hydroxy-6-metoxy-1,4-benzoquinol methylase